MNMKKILKFLITNFKKVTLYGDMELGGSEDILWVCEFNGSAIRVQILKMFWITYSYYRIK